MTPYSTMGVKTVEPAHISGPALSDASAAGMGTANSAWQRTELAHPPGRSMIVARGVAHRFSLPRTHHSPYAAGPRIPADSHVLPDLAYAANVRADSGDDPDHLMPNPFAAYAVTLITHILSRLFRPIP
jgi:hypothetical protein